MGGSYQLALGPVARPVIVKIGGAYRTVTRTSETRAYDIVNRTLTEEELSQSPERIFDGTYAMDGRLTLRANAFAGSYDADDKVGAGYAMVDIPVGSRLKLIGGARVEQWDLSVLTRTVQGDTVRAAPNKTDLLPSLALNVQLSDNQNLRLSGSQTVSRPEYRELSPVPYFEQVGLLTTFGNTTLRRASVLNGDVRWEWFPSAGEVVSVSVFTKRFDDPIEKVIILQAGAPALSFVNATSANNYGVEVELRKNLGMFTESLLPFTFFANSTLMRSDIEPGNEVLTNTNRPMVGQSEYVVNAGLGYLGGDGRFNATLLYNVTGRRIAEAGASGLPDTYENARQFLDASVQLSLFGETSLRLDGKNILDRPVEFVQGGVTRHRYTTGRVFSLGFSWKP
jgi:TonB-dependent receptor